jgi:hypothetical protein
LEWWVDNNPKLTDTPYDHDEKQDQRLTL